MQIVGEEDYTSFQETEILVFYLPRPQKCSNMWRQSATSYIPWLKATSKVSINI